MVEKNLTKPPEKPQKPVGRADNGNGIEFLDG